jgi:hypothetical protein
MLPGSAANRSFAANLALHGAFQEPSCSRVLLQQKRSLTCRRSQLPASPRTTPLSGRGGSACIQGSRVCLRQEVPCRTLAYSFRAKLTCPVWKYERRGIAAKQRIFGNQIIRSRDLHKSGVPSFILFMKIYKAPCLGEDFIVLLMVSKCTCSHTDRAAVHGKVTGSQAG